jgi:release factor glutamine methyltransferase
MFNSLDIQKKFDIIVSNPPYIKTEVIKTLDKEVQNEPVIALDGGADGLRFYRELIDNAHKYLVEGGNLFMEIGYDQKNSIMNLINESKNYKNIYFKKDLGNNYRLCVAKV